MTINRARVRDLRGTSLYKECESLYVALRQPGTGQISDASELDVSPDDKRAAFAATIVESLEGMAPTRICQVDLTLGDVRFLTFGPNSDRLPKYSPDGRLIAFLSDRYTAGDFQLYLLDTVSGAAHATRRIEGWVEYIHWSPDGRFILLGVAGRGADVSGKQGAIASTRVMESAPSWMPSVDAGDETYRWRRAWTYELSTGRVRQVSPAGSNVWEADWCGDDYIVAVVSCGPGEGLWYSAGLYVISTDTGESREIYRPPNQIGWPAGSPTGKRIAVVEATCSDRWSVAGELRLIDPISGGIQGVDTGQIDITDAKWLSERDLLLAGHRGFEAAVCVYDAATERIREVWSSSDTTTSEYIKVAPLKSPGDCVLVGESFTRAPEIALIRQGTYRPIKSLDLDSAHHASAVGKAEQVSWPAPDGLEIQGWLLRPTSGHRHPLVMNIHGGPVSHWRPTWLGRRGLPALMLLKHCYAVFLPNPRGSSGRGQDFARRVLGDMGGADTYDYLSGIDHLVARDMADPERLGVTGISYGGFMASWLITQDSRFAAAVSTAPVTNHITEHLLSNIPRFVAMFLADTYANIGGKYYSRSPVIHADKVRTPTLNICGALDRCTPPAEAIQFHNALLENGVESVLVTYPEEGHAIRKLPAAIDYAARLVAWFQEHMPAMTVTDRRA
jgi:dipeptidyl aminopeptidase/acylaminoacyl peptidase